MTQRLTASQRIAKELHGQILRRKYIAGERLPTERKLAGYYGVSRIPVREAMKLLEQQGIVEIKHGSGNYVKYIDQAKISEQLSQYLLLYGSELSELTEIWKILEYNVISHLCKNRTEAQLQELKMLAAECATEVRCALDGQPFNFAGADRAFHEHIARLSPNKLIANLLCAFHESVAFKNSVLAAHSNEWEKILSIHSAIIDGIANHNEAMASHAISEDLSLGGSLFSRFTARYRSQEETRSSQQ